MEKLTKITFRLGCLLSIAAPLLALLIYPKANWLFAFLLFPIVLVLLARLFVPDVTAKEIADRAERLLEGTYGDYDVDDYEHLSPRNLFLRDLWRKTMEIGGLPEEWVGLDEQKKSEIRQIIQLLRTRSSNQVNTRGPAANGTP